jgi:hypothetical protein
MHNSAEPIQIESGDVVLALPFKVNAQSTCEDFAVNAHCECCIPDTFHISRSFRLFTIELVYFIGGKIGTSYSAGFIRPAGASG